ncbi:MAG TPA: ATP-dependent Clp protease ATP-binding subunit [Candidatus Wirthbacteria bacterium]|nr:ATP-dependent Clp protease ATP-binding subunit [Candidatus Wirthbacteria bacterium]
MVVWLDVQADNRNMLKNLDIANFKRGGKLDKGWQSGWTLTLNRHAKDLTKAARKGELRKVVGREDTIDSMARVLSRSTKRNVILLGETGVGKTTLVEGLAHQIVTGEVELVLRDKRLMELNIGSVVGAAKDANQFGDIMSRILREISNSKNVVLCLDNIHLLKGTGAAEGSGLDAFSILEPALTRNEFQCIGTTTYSEYKKFISNDEAFSRCFEIVEVPEPNFDDTVRILFEVVLGFEHKHKVIVSYEAIKDAISLSQKYLHEKVLPDKALDLLDEACVMVSRKKKKIVTANDIADIIAIKTHIPVREVTTEESNKLLNLEEIMHERLVGQKEAVLAVCNAVRRARAGLQDTNRPIATFLFVGPTGVGKTELAKTLAEAYFGHENMMIRLDMSEYQDTDSIYRLLGAPPGQKGYDEGGQLTEAIRKRPFSLLLLDEFEKASSNIHDIFLQVFDDGRLTDSSGRVVDFTHTIIIATSNAGAKLIQDGLLQKRDYESIKQELIQAVLPTIFKPELINRFDGTVLFKPLNQEQVHQIAGRLLGKVRDKLRVQDIQFKITKNAVDKLSVMGFDPAYGARPLRRVIQDRVEDPIAAKILRGEINRGETMIVRSADI